MNSRADVGACQHMRAGPRTGRAAGGTPAPRPCSPRRLLALIDDAAGDRLNRGLGDDSALIGDRVHAVLGDAPDDPRAGADVDVRQVPVLVVDAQHLVGEVLGHRHDVALLGLGAHDGLGQGSRGPRARSPGRSRCRSRPRHDLRAPAGETAAADVLEPDGDAQIFRAVADRLVRLAHGQDVLEERVGHLDRPAVLLLLFFAHDLGGKGAAAEARVIGRLADRG